jgi:hypothetical protein
MAQVSRNDPCPCGSGLKYKKCCLGKAPPMRGRRLLWRALAAVVAVGAAVTIGVLQGIKTGLGAGVVVALIIVILFVVRSPPPSSGGHTRSGDINFGR